MAGRIVGMPGINVLSFSLPPQRDFFFFLLSLSKERIRFSPLREYERKAVHTILTVFDVWF